MTSPMSRSGQDPDPIGAAPEEKASVSGFWSLIVTQFEGAFNDNALKTLVLFFGMNLALSER